jgi:hypothetical protein
MAYSGKKPLNIGMNAAKRRAKRLDKQDQLAVLENLGPGHRRQHGFHQQLVRSRHQYYHEQHEELVRGQPRAS